MGLPPADYSLRRAVGWHPLLAEVGANNGGSAELGRAAIGGGCGDRRERVGHIMVFERVAVGLWLSPASAAAIQAEWPAAGHTDQ